MKDKLIVALDVPTLPEARRFVQLLKSEVSHFKVGSVLFTAVGPDVVKMIHDEGGNVFLDLKFHDIPNTVAKACEAAAGLGVWMMNVHSVGGEEMLKAAASVIRPHSDKILLGVTVLTSEATDESVSAEVVRRAKLCQDAGLHGVVCSAHEIEAVRQACGPKFIILTPGIRPIGSEAGDQKRVATPQEAFQKGADFIVMGRPIYSSKDPLSIVRNL